MMCSFFFSLTPPLLLAVAHPPPGLLDDYEDPDIQHSWLALKYALLRNARTRHAYACEFAAGHGAATGDGSAGALSPPGGAGFRVPAGRIAAVRKNPTHP